MRVSAITRVFCQGLPCWRPWGKLTCQFVAVLAGHDHDPISLDGNRGGCAGKVGNVGNADDHDVAGCLVKEKNKHI